MDKWADFLLDGYSEQVKVGLFWCIVVAVILTALLGVINWLVERSELRDGVNMSWSDYQHYCLLPFTRRIYYIYEGCLYESFGVYKRRENQCPMYLITDITVEISLFQRLLGTGTLVIKARDETDRTIVLKNIREPKRVRNMIQNLSEKQKAKKEIIIR